MRALMLLLILTIAASVFPTFGDALAYDRERVAGGELWRLLTAHLAHDNAKHCVLDLVSVAILAAACERVRRNSAGLATILAFLTVSFGLLPLTQDVDQYRGLSTIASSLFVCAAVLLLRDARRRRETRRVTIASMLLVGFLGKTLFEAAAGTALFAGEVGTAPWPMAHLVGAAAGLLGALVADRESRRNENELFAPIPETST